MWSWSNLYQGIKALMTKTEPDRIEPDLDIPVLDDAQEFDEIGHFENACCGPGYCCLCDGGVPVESSDNTDEEESQDQVK